MIQNPEPHFVSCSQIKASSKTHPPCLWKHLVLLLMGLLVGQTTASAFQFNRTPAGLIKGARLERVSDTAIKIGVGYGDILGSYWEIPSDDVVVTNGYTLTGLTTTTAGIYHYIYIDRANSSLPFIAITNSTNAPNWSNDFMGWYSGQDRCIGAVWVKPDGKIQLFYCSDDETYVWSETIFFSPGSPSTTAVWNTTNLSPYVPANTYEIRAGLSMWGAWTFTQVGLKATGGDPIYENGVTQSTIIGYLPFSRGAAKNCQWLATASSTTGNVQLSVRGYRLER